MKSIFVQIASYRDPELRKTVLDMVDKADNPENLRICIGWQHGPEENIIDLLKVVKNLRIIDIPYRRSKGVCQIRNRIQQEYRGEEYTLCIDSHHRFAKGWDTMCIDMHKKLEEKGKKPLLTAYLPSYEPKNDPKGRINEAWRLKFDRFTPEGCIFFTPEVIPNWENLEEPVRGRFVSAHFIFTEGKWNEEVTYDPNYYFHGEEINLAVRSFTHGYDLFHPHKVVCWHEYTRVGRTKVWDDDNNWPEKNSKSHSRNRQLFFMDPRTINFGKFGFGTERSLEEYEMFSGIIFKDRSVQQDTIDGVYPPNLLTYKTKTEWRKSFKRVFKHCVDLDKNLFKEDDYEFWVFCFLVGDKEIFREDISKDEIDNIFLEESKEKSGTLKVWKSCLVNDFRPNKAMIWPKSKKGWSEKIVIDIGD